MPELYIDGVKAKVDEGATVLDASNLLFVEIPTLCHLKGSEPETSCMLCVVKDCATGRLIPACSTKAAEGMEIDTECDEVQSARREVLNLLLSEHVGDCVAPCTRICPASLDIPRMLRELAQGNAAEAEWIARRDLAIPNVLSHVCPAPCEKGCRRAQVDSAIAIRSLHRTEGAAEGSAAEGSVPYFRAEGSVPYFSNYENTGLTPSVTPGVVAVIGSGPAGLAAAWQLRLLGYGCTVFDANESAGGALRDLPEETLPKAVLDADIGFLKEAGIVFELGKPVLMHEVAAAFQGVLFAETEFSGTHFADAFYAEEHKLTVKAVANGKAAAEALDRFLKGEPPERTERFDFKLGKLRDSEAVEFTKNCGKQAGMPAPQSEAARCLHCDCRKPVSCKLRKYAEKYGADQREYPADERKHVQLIGQGESVVFEPGKCIKCGLCIRITKQADEALGLAFVGRGFNAQVAVPFGESLENALQKSAKECVEVCPTGALAFREAEESEI